MSESGFLSCVALDVDGVAADFLGAVRRELRQTAPIFRPVGWDEDERAEALTHHGVASYDTLDPALAGWLWPRVDGDPNWWARVPPLAEVELRGKQIAVEIVRLKRRADVLWVTSRRSRACPAGEQTAEWLQNGLLDGFPNVVAVPDWRRKVELFRVLQPFAVVDDRPEILAGARVACPKALVLAPPWPDTAGVVPDADRCGLADALGRIADEAERRWPS